MNETERRDKHHSIFVRVQLIGVDDCGTIILCVLVAVTVTDKDEVGKIKGLTDVCRLLRHRS